MADQTEQQQHGKVIDNIVKRERADDA